MLMLMLIYSISLTILEHNLDQVFICIVYFHDHGVCFFEIIQITTFNISLVVHGTVAEKSLYVSSPIVLQFTCDTIPFPLFGILVNKLFCAE